MAYHTVNGKVVKKTVRYTGRYHNGNLARTPMYPVTRAPLKTEKKLKEAPHPEAKNMSMKGKFDGLCNRSACLRPGAKWYNRGSYAFYCEDCAHMLNRENGRWVEQDLGGKEPLCNLVANEKDAEKFHVH